MTIKNSTNTEEDKRFGVLTYYQECLFTLPPACRLVGLFALSHTSISAEHFDDLGIFALKIRFLQREFQCQPRLTEH